MEFKNIWGNKNFEKKQHGKYRDGCLEEALGGCVETHFQVLDGPFIDCELDFKKVFVKKSFAILEDTESTGAFNWPRTFH